MVLQRVLTSFRRLAAPDAAASCACGHRRAAHEHLRSGSDCALCPRGVCTRFHTA